MVNTLYRYIVLIVICSLIACDSGVKSNPNASVTPEPEVTEPDTSPIDPGEGGLNWTLSFTNNIGVLSNPTYSEYLTDYGFAVAVGDWNNDNIQDVAVGAQLADVQNANSGTVFIYYGSSSLYETDDLSPDVRLENPNGLASQFGSALVSTDNNGDGIDDLIVGADTDDRGPSNDNEGAVYFFYGSSAGLSTSPGQILDEPNGDRDDGFGTSLAVGDLDGDGFDELVVGTRYGDAVATNAGQVWIFQGQSTGIYDASDNVQITDAGAAATEYFGESVAIFDYDNDTNLDILIGAPREDTGGTDRGAVHVYLGNGTAGSFVGSNSVPSSTITNPLASDSSYFGSSIAIADVDNDSAPDLIVGAPLTDIGPSNSGSIRIFKDIRSATTEDDSVDQPNIAMTADSYWGYSLAVADINSDGTNDLLVGGTRSDDFSFNIGKISVFHGAATGDWNFVEDKRYAAFSEVQPRKNFNSNFGSAACEGDFNGDGIDDLAVGAELNDELAADEGVIYIYYTPSSGSFINKPDLTIYASATGSGRRFGNFCTVTDFNQDGNDDLVVGGYYDDAGPGNDSGSVFVFYGTATGLSTTVAATIVNPADGSDGFGHGVAFGDVNNDGFDDMAIGANLDDTAGADRGTVYLYESDNSTGVIDTANPQLFDSGAVNGDQYGAGVAIADVDGDGDEELIVGIPFDDTANTDAGRLAVYDNPGTPNTLITNASVSYINSPTGTDNTAFGEYLNTKNYSSTTYKDLFVGAVDDDVSATNGGALYIYSGSASGIAASPSASFRGLDTTNPANESVGSSAAVIDVDQDGDLDVVVGAETDDQTGVDSGSVYIIKQ